LSALSGWPLRRWAGDERCSCATHHTLGCGGSVAGSCTDQHRWSVDVPDADEPLVRKTQEEMFGAWNNYSRQHRDVEVLVGLP
jgi:hypothetical protein